MSENAWSPWSRGFDVMLEEARRAIDAQRGSLDSIRGRASWNLTAAGSAAALFVSLGDDPGGLAFAGLVVVVGVATCTLVVLLPRTFFMEMNPYEIREAMPGLAGPTEMIDGLALRMWDNFVANEKILERLYDVYVCSSVLFIVEVGLFGIDIVIH